MTINFDPLLELDYLDFDLSIPDKHVPESEEVIVF